MTEPDSQDLLTRLRLAAERQRDMEVKDDFRAVLNEMATSAPDMTPDPITLVEELLPTLSSPIGVGYLCVWIGASVEGGRPAEQTMSMVIDAFLRWSRAVPVTENGTEAAKPDQEVLGALSLLASSTVSHLRLLPETARRALDTQELFEACERIAHLSDGASWVLQKLRQESGDLVFLLAERKTGYLLRYENLTNCFHLFTLLQNALADEKPKSATLDRQAVAVASGDEDGDCTDRAWWHYSQPHATEANIAASIWGEGAPGDIAEVAGTRIMVGWQTVLGSRSWDAGFFTPILQQALPKVELVRELSDEETDAWWQKLSLPEPKPWWKVWSR